MNTFDPRTFFEKKEPLYKQGVRALARRLWRMYRTYQRRLEVDPNCDSDFKVEKYMLGLSHKVVQQGAHSFGMSTQPDVSMRVQKIYSNVQEPGLYIITEIRTANVGLIVGGNIDAYTLRDGLEVDSPTLTPANKVFATVMRTDKPATKALVPLEEHNHFVRYVYDAVHDISKYKTLKEMREGLKLLFSHLSRPVHQSEYETFSLTLTGPASICF